jgi:hypothetical protein
MSAGSDILSGILLRAATLVDQLLGYYVSGNTLTDPNGVQLASSLSTIIHNMTIFYSQLSLLLLYPVNSL